MPAPFGIWSKDVNLFPKNPVNIFQNKGPLRGSFAFGVMPSSASCSSLLRDDSAKLSRQAWDYILLYRFQIVWPWEGFLMSFELIYKMLVIVHTPQRAIVRIKWAICVNYLVHCLAHNKQ